MLRTALLLGLVGCGAARRPTTLDVVTLAASSAGLALDWRQTRIAAEQSWSRNRIEEGFPSQMLIGAHPAPRAVDGYFAATALINLALWAALPPRWRSAVPGMLVGVEATAVIGSWSVTPLWGSK